MTERAAGAVLSAVVLGLFLFIGSWFGWKTAFLILVMAIVSLGALSAVSPKK
jgi:predicted MFS family arabinose efflux permease